MYKKSSDHTNVLLLAFHSYAGMGPYVVSIINSFKEEDNVFFFLMEGNDRYYSNNVSSKLKHKCLIKHTTTNKLRPLFETIFGEISPVRNEIKRFCQEKKIEVIHDLTGITDVGLTKYLTNHFNFILTVHDLVPHENNNSFLKRWRMNGIYKRLYQSINHSRYLLTNSKTQLAIQQKRYPEKQHFYSKFPTLITAPIANGTQIVHEIAHLSDYVLFFGRIEAYKGVEVLLEAFCRYNPYLDTKLVIAGKGELNDPIEDSRVIRINRYIKDEEIAFLYRNAAVVVYPYISATQSGVLSVASYFSTPIIASDVPFFSETLGKDYELMFESKDAHKLANIIKKFFSYSQEEKTRIKTRTEQLYNQQYSDTLQRENLLGIYTSLKSENNL